MKRRIGRWWRRSSRGKRTSAIGGAVLLAIVVVLAVLVIRLLRPAASIDDYARYYDDDTTPLKAGEVAITFFGVSTILFDDGDTQLLVDAFFTRPTPVEYLTEMRSSEEAVAGFVGDYAMDRVDAVLVAHSHVDHAIDAATIADLTGATVFGTESTLNIARGGGVGEGQLALAVSGQSIEVGDFTVRIEESPHSELPGVVSHEDPPTIDEPLEQPATNEEFAAGGNLSFVIGHGGQTYVVVASANYRPGALEGIDADVLLLGTALLGMQDASFQQAYLDETIGRTTPEIVVPLHWDDFIRPWRRGQARFNPRIIDTEPAEGFDLVIDRVGETGAEFVVLQAGARLVVAG